MPAKKLKIIKKINRDAHISVVQKPIIPSNTLIKKKRIRPMEIEIRKKKRVTIFVCRKNGGLRRIKISSSSTTANAVFISLSPISLANQ